MQMFNLSTLLAEHQAKKQRWLEFLRVSSCSMGLYCLKAGQDDPQQPHTEDEVYYVIAGKASLVVGEQRRTVGAGDLLFVERLTEHRFCEVTEDLTLLVFFAPREGSRAGENNVK